MEIFLEIETCPRASNSSVENYFCITKYSIISRQVPGIYKGQQNTHWSDQSRRTGALVNMVRVEAEKAGTENCPRGKFWALLEGELPTGG